MSTPNETTWIAVAGDIVVDRHAYDDAGRGVFDKAELGGAAVLFRLLRALATKRHRIGEEARAAHPSPADLARVPLVAVRLAITEPTLDGLPPGHNAYAVWAPYKRVRDGDARVWRVARAMGYGLAGDAPEAEVQPTPVAGPRPHVLVLDDGAFDFRRSARSAWCLPQADEPSPEWIVLKTSRPVTQGELWHELTKRFADRLVCIVSADALRSEFAGISTGMSWERTVGDIAAARDKDAVLKELMKCRHLIVTFSLDGALWVDRADGAQPRAKLVFDRARAEGEWGEARDGGAFGYLSCVAAAVAQSVAEQVATRKDGLDLEVAIGVSLQAMRDLLDNGHGVVGAPPNGYPVGRLAQLLAEAKSDFSVAPVDLARAAEARDSWMMVSEPPYVPDAPDQSRHAVVLGLARQIVINGHRALGGAAHAKFGKLVTADRTEIEALRDLRRLMLGYRGNAKAEKPLSIGVFGPPGAGKSFGVRQLAEEVFGAKAWLEFNLSQFAGSTDLVGAFHQVRDRVLEGITPVVFWDEFDSREYSWLQYLLAPMQDGRFQEVQLTHAIGKCVFVFAGGTSYSYNGFGAEPGEAAARSESGDRAAGTKPDDPAGKAKFKLAKGPDFKSRLDGYYDVLGPNQRALPGDPEKPDPSDICVALRRALFIRSKLAEQPHERLDIDPDLLDALLLAARYKNGARSLEKLLLELKAPAGRPIRRSSLPPPARLAMYVDKTTFDRILDRNTGYRMSEVIDRLAAMIHAHWRARTAKKGDHLDKEYAELAPIDQEDNRAAARRIPDVLSLVGLGLAPAKEAESAEKPTASEVERCIKAHIELLAEAEHEGWMAQRAKNGWRYGTPRDEARKLHPLMLPYRDLDGTQKEQDRDAVRKYPAQVKDVGLEIVWLKGVVARPDSAATK